MKLFYDDEFDAIAQAISDSGKEFKTVAAHIFPDMKPESAYAKLKKCVHPDADERLTFGQVIRLMKFCEAFDPLMHACDETLHARPDRKAPEDEEAKLSGVIQHAADTMERAMKAIERIQRRNEIKAVA